MPFEIGLLVFPNITQLDMTGPYEVFIKFPEAKVRPPKGGYFLGAELPVGVSGEAVADQALKHGVEVSSGRLSFPEDDPGNFLRFAYSYPEPDQIREGIRRLGVAYREVVAQA